MMRRLALAASAMLILTPAAAFAADTVRTEVVRAGGYVRIQFIWPEADAEAPLTAETSVDNQVLVVRFSREVALDTAPILNGLSAEAALARMDADRRTLRVALRTPARSHVSRSYNILAVDLLPPEAADPEDVVSPRALAEAEARRAAEEAAALAALEPPPPLARLDVRRATSTAFDRIVFDWPEQVDYTLEPRGAETVLRFSRDAEPDLGSLRADPPARLAAIEARHADGALAVHFVPAPGAEARAFRDGNAVIVDLVTAAATDEGLLAGLEALAEDSGAAPDAPAEAPPPEDLPPTEFTSGAPTRLIDEAPAPEEYAEAEPEAAPAPTPEADPVPESGVVAVKALNQGPDLLIEFPWAAPVRAAAFRRADAIWIVFGAQAALDLAEIERGQRHVTDAQMLSGPGYSAVRITAPGTTQVSLRGHGANWVFALSEQIDTAPTAITVEREAQPDGAAGRLLAALPDAGAPVWIDDPVVGDRLLVTPAGGPARGVLEQRRYLSFSILPSAHGLAVETLSAGLHAETAPEGVWISPPSGGAAAPMGPQALAAGPSPAVIPFAGADAAAHYEADRAEIEKQTAADDLPSAQMRMARFLLSHELAPEALGMLRLAAERDAQLAADPEFRALRGVAYALAGRWREAENDLSHLALEDDAAAQLWRAWVRAQAGDWIGARRAFETGAEAIAQFGPEWRARFREAYARTALELNDLATARDQVDLAGAESAPEATMLRIALDAARWRELAGQPDDALAAYAALTTSGDEEIEARAILAHARLSHEQGRTGVSELVEALEALRWRWRGDEIELETIRALGALYIAQGQTRQGLEAMRAAVARFPEHPVSRTMFTDMTAMFNELFLEGGADRLDPVEAVALYFQFSDLTPIGAEGDRMIRRLSERLVTFDLLPQAAELLQHQVDERLHEPRARAQVAADLALIYLMDRRAEAALRTLRGTRVTQLPPALAEERKIIEARALAELDANEAALDLIAGDASVEAARLRADIAWSLRDWPLAGRRLEEMLGERYSAPAPIGAEDSASVLRAAVAYSLARDTESLDRLDLQYGALMRGGPDSAAFTAVTQELETSGLRLAEIADRAADVTAIETFLAARRDRLQAPMPRAAVEQAGAVSGAAPNAGTAAPSEEAAVTGDANAG